MSKSNTDSKSNIDELRKRYNELNQLIKERDKEEQYRVHSSAEHEAYKVETDKLRSDARAMWEVCGKAYGAKQLRDEAIQEAKRIKAEAEAKIDHIDIIGRQAGQLLDRLNEDAGLILDNGVPPPKVYKKTLRPRLEEVGDQIKNLKMVLHPRRK